MFRCSKTFGQVTSCVLACSNTLSDSLTLMCSCNLLALALLSSEFEEALKYYKNITFLHCVHVHKWLNFQQVITRMYDWCQISKNPAPCEHCWKCSKWCRKHESHLLKLSPPNMFNGYLFFFQIFILMNFKFTT